MGPTNCGQMVACYFGKNQITQIVLDANFKRSLQYSNYAAMGTIKKYDDIQFAIVGRRRWDIFEIFRATSVGGLLACE